MCQYDEGFTINEMLEETVQCKNCTLSCPNKGKTLNARVVSRNLSPTDVAPVVHAKWIKSNIGGAKICSSCNAHMGLSNFRYCPNCGARMDGE